MRRRRHNQTRKLIIFQDQKGITSIRFCVFVHATYNLDLRKYCPVGGNLISGASKTSGCLFKITAKNPA